MIHFLRNHRGHTLVDCEATPDDISCVVDIETFSDYLLGLDPEEQTPFIRDMSDVQEIRGLYHEVIGAKRTPDEVATGYLTKLADRWNLSYVTD